MLNLRVVHEMAEIAMKPEFRSNVTTTRRIIHLQQGLHDLRPQLLRRVVRLERIRNPRCTVRPILNRQSLVLPTPRRAPVNTEVSVDEEVRRHERVVLQLHRLELSSDVGPLEYLVSGHACGSKMSVSG